MKKVLLIFLIFIVLYAIIHSIPVLDNFVSEWGGPHIDYEDREGGYYAY